MTLQDLSVDKRIYKDIKDRIRTGRGRSGRTPYIIVLHVQEGENDLSEYFKGIDADSTCWSKEDGTMVRLLNDEDCTWTNGNYTKPNLNNPIIADAYRRGIYPGDICLTIEHQGYYKQGFTEAQIKSTINMVAYWCKKFNIPVDRNHIVPHADFDSVTRANCPGPKFPLDRVINEVKALTTDAPAPQEKEEAHYFKETDKWIVNVLPDGTRIGFWDYWQSLGLAQLGFPISGAFYDERRKLIVQWTERGRLEYHPENTDPKFKVLEGLTGKEAYDFEKNPPKGNDAELARLQNEVNWREALINQLRSDVASRDSQITAKDAALKDKDATLAKVQKQADDRYQEIMTLKAQINSLTADLQNCRNAQQQNGGGSGNTGEGTGGNGTPPAPVGELNFNPPVRLNLAAAAWRPTVRVNPVSGVPYIIGESGSAAPEGAVLLFRGANSQPLNINDGPSTVPASARMAFDRNGYCYVAWRARNPGFVGRMRQLDPNGNPVGPGWWINPFAGTGFDIDQPDIAYSSKTNKLYMVGQIQSNPPTLGFAESVDGGKTWMNYKGLMYNRPTGMNIQPRIAVDENDNVHVMFFWNDNLCAMSRINGVWANQAWTVADSHADNWMYRQVSGIAARNGEAYIVTNSAPSVLLSRWTGSEWKLVAKDALKGVRNPQDCYVEILPDGRLLLLAGYRNNGEGNGLELFVSNDKGATFTGPIVLVQHNSATELCEVSYSAKTGKVVAVGTFTDPRDTFYVETK